jgi:hypothetical protein
MDIEAWLQGLGLERYTPPFRDNEIDWEVLPKLTSEDLRETGVAAVGHRRKLLGAIPRSAPRRPLPQSRQQSPAHRLPFLSFPGRAAYLMARGFAPRRVPYWHPPAPLARPDGLPGVGRLQCPGAHQVWIGGQ